MIRAAILALPLLLGACANQYSLQSGDLNYDELRRESDACKARGGTIQPKQQGGDPNDLSNYTCVVPKGQS